MRKHDSAMAIGILASASVAFGQTTHNVDGSNACPGNGSAVDPFCQIQPGIDAAEDGDDVVVQPGTYLEAIDFGGRAITVRSASGDPGDTIIDGTGHLHVVQFVTQEGADSGLQGFTLTGGNANGAAFPDNAGAGVLCDGAGPTITNCIFDENAAEGSGGGLYVRNGGNLTVSRCIFRRNSAGLWGGGMLTLSSDPTVTQSAFLGNTATFGAGLSVFIGGSPSITQCTFTNNAASTGGGAIYNDSGTLAVVNSVLWGNAPNEIVDVNTGDTTVATSDVESGGTANGNLNVDPNFVNALGADNIPGTTDDDVRVQPGSPCIDSGNNAAIPIGQSLDLGGLPRISHAITDMGAYEFQDDDGDGVLDDDDSCPGFDDTIDSNGNGVPDGCDTASVHNLTQETDHFTIQGAIDSAFNGDDVVVDPGTYHEAIDFIGRAISLRSTSGDPANTIIDGSGHFHVVQSVNGEGPDTVLEGFTITGGNATGLIPNNRGGGMYCIESNPTVRHCIFRNNTATAGGGMFVGSRLGAPTNNVVRDCVFMDNDARAGGGLYDQASGVTVHRCRFLRNTSLDGGGGYYMSFVGSNITNCLFSMNSGPPSGRAIYVLASKARITNCTVYDEQAGGADFQLYIGTNSEFAEVTNSLFRSSLGGQVLDDSNTAQVSYCNLERGFPGIGNLDANPLFVDPDGADNVPGTPDDDFRIQTGSPCIDAGNSEVVLLAFSTDLDGNQRVVDDPMRTDTGVGIPEVVDIGAYEFGSAPQCKSLQGDFNCDGVVDLHDFATFMKLFTGPF